MICYYEVMSRKGEEISAINKPFIMLLYNREDEWRQNSSWSRKTLFSLVNQSQIFKKVTWKEIMTDQPTNQPTGQFHF